MKYPQRLKEHVYLWNEGWKDYDANPKKSSKPISVDELIKNLETLFGVKELSKEDIRQIISEWEALTVADSQNLCFGGALKALKAGKLVARAGWNGKGMFLFIRPADTLTTGFIPNVKSLPQAVKDWIDQNLDDKINQGETGLTPVHFGAYICMKAADNTIVNGWLASQTDLLAEDWYVL